jgi:anti-sigma factor RsiW
MNDPLCNQLDDYLGGWLADGERRAFEAHLAPCKACAEEVRLQRAMNQLLALAHPTAPPGLVEQVEAALRTRRRRFARNAVAVAAALGCIMAGGLWRLEHRSPKAASPIPDAPALVETAPQHVAPSSLDRNSADSAALADDVKSGAPGENPIVLQESASREDVVSVDGGPGVILLPEPTDDPTVHMFWVYPTVGVSQRESAPMLPSSPNAPASPSERSRL